MKSVVALILAISVSGVLSPLLRSSNSRVLSEQGLEQFEAGEYMAAAQLFEQSRELRTTAETTFDLGTSLVGAGEHGRGEEILRSLTGDEALAVPSLYNAGNSQLVRGALDDAIESYTEVLRRAPSNMSAKRNLEIALRRREQQQQQQENGSGAGEEEGDEQEQRTEGQDEQESELDPDLERVLRSIEQQEREELSRMRRQDATQRPTDW